MNWIWNFRVGVLAALLLVGGVGCGQGISPVSTQVQPEAQTTTPPAPAITIDNPYADIDWATIERHRANFHTHTTESDGRETPDQVIDRYHALHYRVLALTDHDTMGPEHTTWPWSRFNRDPAELGMVAIEGNELSRHHHTGSYFSGYGDANVANEEVALERIGHHHGTAVLFHPGRYNKPIEWYVKMYRTHDHLVGFEVFNQRDRYPGDRAMWDQVLTELMPDRPVWAFSNDDMHQPKNHMGFSWNMMLLTELNEAAVRQAMETGRFYFVHCPQGPEGDSAPVIEKIDVDPQAGTITLQATGHDKIQWISRGKVIFEGPTLDLTATPEGMGYVRGELRREDGTFVGTQPFGLRRQDDAAADGTE